MEKLRFIHIPKNGGTSVKRWLDKNNIEFLLGKNAKRVGFHKPASYFSEEDTIKFTLVRNPYTRLVSWFHFRAKPNGHKDFKKWVYDILPNYINENLTSIEDKNINKLQSMYIYAPLDKDVRPLNLEETKKCFDWSKKLVDHVFKLEEIDELKKFIGLDIDFPQENKSTHNDPMSYYDNDLKEFVYKLYDIDFKLLGYDK